MYGFLGPNGAGKSTTMNIMTGCLSATKGQVKIEGYDIFEQPDKAKKMIGYLCGRGQGVAGGRTEPADQPGSGTNPDRERAQPEHLPNALSALSADSFTDEEPGDKLEIGLTLHLDTKEEASIQVDLYRYDGTNCLAVVDGEPVCLVARSSVMDLVEAVNAIVLN